MKCPICDVDLLLSDRHGVEIDYCPSCRGIWLDRGELDKLLERAALLERGLAAPDSGSRHAHGGHYHHGHDRHDHHHREKSLFHKIFDF